MDKEEILDAARAMAPWLVETRRRLHACPELGLEEHRTADMIEGWLEGMAIERRRSGTAIVGLVRGAHPGPTVALRADIDALPIKEKRDLPWKSRNEGVMHACGHDAHTAILLGAARFFSDRRESLSGNVKLLFQPAEETEGGAETMIREGCLENPRVDAVLGLHVMPYLPVGLIETKKGALNGSSATLKIRVKGKGGHGAYPESGIDAVLIASNVVMSLNTLIGRYVSPLESAVFSVGTISGGSRSNIIADSVEMEATMRTTSDEVRETLVSRAKAIVEGIPASFGGSGELEVRYGYEALINHDAEVELVAAAAEDILGKGCVRWKEKASMGVEDFSYFLKERPGAFWHLGCGNPELGIAAALHTENFDIDEDCLRIGVAVQAAAAARILAR